MYSDSKYCKKRDFNSYKKGVNNVHSHKSQIIPIKEQVKYTIIIFENISGGCISVTPQMIREALKKLHLRKAYVNSYLISQYLRHYYPVENDLKIFTEELRKKLDCAVRVGLIIKHGEDAYCLPTLREEANIFDTTFTAFWEMYKNYPTSATQTRYQNRKHSTSKKK